MDDKSYSYFQPSFVDFYDTMVETCYGGIHSADMQEFCAVFRDRRALRLHQNSEFRTVDLGTGTGRCIVALLSSLQEDGATQQQQFQFLGVDNSKVMIEKAREKLPNIDDAGENVSVRLMLQSLEDWDVPEWHEGVDLIIAAAGPFHHLLTEEALVKALRQIHLHLKRGSDGVAVINLLSPDELFHREVRDSEGVALTEEVFKVGPYRRWREHHEMSFVDGARLVHEKFRLTRLSSDEKVEWEELEEWTLREVDKDRLVHLAGQVGLDEAPDLGMPCKSCVFFCRK